MSVEREASRILPCSLFLYFINFYFFFLHYDGIKVGTLHSLKTGGIDPGGDVEEL